jgi:hypothetical protein
LPENGEWFFELSHKYSLFPKEKEILIIDGAIYKIKTVK